MKCFRVEAVNCDSFIRLAGKRTFFKILLNRNKGKQWSGKQQGNFEKRSPMNFDDDPLNHRLYRYLSRCKEHFNNQYDTAEISVHYKNYRREGHDVITEFLISMCSQLSTIVPQTFFADNFCNFPELRRGTCAPVLASFRFSGFSNTGTAGEFQSEVHSIFCFVSFFYILS